MFSILFDSGPVVGATFRHFLQFLIVWRVIGRLLGFFLGRVLYILVTLFKTGGERGIKLCFSLFEVILCSSGMMVPIRS